VNGVQQWAEIRRMKFVEGLSGHEIHRRTGLHRKTIRRALESDEPPRYARPPRPSKLDPFREEIRRLLQEDPRIPAKRSDRASPSTSPCTSRSGSCRSSSPGFRSANTSPTRSANNR
jgi:transposase